MKNDDKVSKFVAAITQEADDRRAQIMKEAEDFIEAEMKKAEDEALAESYQLIQRKIASIHAGIGREQAKRQQELKKQLFARREEITRAVMAEAREQIAAFAGSDGYGPFLRRSCERAREQFAEGRVTVYLRPQDMDYADIVMDVLPHAVLEEDLTIELGGLKFRGEGSRLFANDTLEERLSSQRHWFFEICGLSTEL